MAQSGLRLARVAVSLRFFSMVMAEMVARVTGATE
jgi:hypothetical protein